jgi:hypothetical protein
VFAVHYVDEVFAGLGRHIRMKRGSLFPWTIPAIQI